MTVEEILKPRYKVIADYPGTNLKIGQIIPEDYGKQPYDEPNNYHLYPAIFKKLEWWEDRKEKDMPIYMKWKSLNSGQLYVVEISKIEGENFTGKFPDGKKINGLFTIGQDLPATKEEYESQ